MTSARIRTTRAGGDKTSRGKDDGGEAEGQRKGGEARKDRREGSKREEGDDGLRIELAVAMTRIKHCLGI